MASEVTLSGSLSFSDGLSDALSLTLAATTDTPTTKQKFGNRLSVLVTEVAIPLGSLATLGWAAFKNLDSTNYIELRVATNGTKFAKLLPGKIALFYFGSGITAPYAIATGGTCWLDYIVVAT